MKDPLTPKPEAMKNQECPSAKLEQLHDAIRQGMDQLAAGLSKKQSTEVTAAQIKAAGRKRRGESTEP